MALAPIPILDPESTADVAAAHFAFFALLRDIRADVQDLERSLVELEQLIASADGDGEALKQAVAASEGVFARVAGEIEERLRAIRGEVYARHPALWDQTGDEFTHVDNLWSRITSDWPRPTLTGGAEIARRIGRVRSLVNQILVHTGRLTIPARLNQHLRSIRVGKALDFHAAFADEVPREADRIELLRYLADHPVAVHGVVDVERGLVFYVSPRFSVRLATYFTPLLVALAGAGIAALAGALDDWLDIDDWPEGMASSSALVTGYLFVLLGAVAHVAVETLKQQRFGGGRSFLALNDALSWIHVRYFSISASVLWVLIGLFGLAATTDDLQWSLAFFVGFSLDSLAGLFLQRFEQAARSSIQALRIGTGG